MIFLNQHGGAGPMQGLSKVIYLNSSVRHQANFHLIRVFLPPLSERRRPIPILQNTLESPYHEFLENIVSKVFRLVDVSTVS